MCVLMQQKLEVDDLHLQLQNLKYEAMHLRREISNCLEFRYIYSAHCVCDCCLWCCYTEGLDMRILT